MQKEASQIDTILIVEDSPMQAERLRQILEKEKFTVLHAENGKVALEILKILKNMHPALIISDVVMPVMNGYEMCLAIKQDELLKTIPIILLTSLSETKELIHGIECQADFFIMKKTEYSSLIDRVHYIIEERKKGYTDTDYYEQVIQYDGTDHLIRSTPKKTLNLLLTTYEIAASRNRELMAVQEKLRSEIDRRIELEEQLKKAKEAAEAASSAKSTFLANMSHEIRTPMNAILGFTQLMLREQGLPAQQKERLETINHSGEHLLELINDILDLSKIEAGLITTFKTTFDLHAFLKHIEAMFRVRTDAKNLWLMLELDPELVRYIITDEGKLRQILINLISNAVKFTREGGVMIRVRTELGSGDGVVLVVAIEDTGVGIHEEELQQLFQVFVQAEAGAQMGGTGLGLALSRQFAKLLGGDVSVKSSNSKGSCFELRITVEKGKAGDGYIKSSRKIIGIEPKNGPLRVLIADDKSNNRNLLSEMLQSEAIQIIMADDGESAVRQFEQWRPHLIMMDLKMPNMNGYEATRIIKGMEGGRETCIIIVTATAFDDDINQLMNSGADAHIRKPLRIGEVYEMIGRHLDVHYIFEEALTPQVKESIKYFKNALAQLPDDLVVQMSQATVNAQLDRLLLLIEEVARTEGKLAEHLQELAVGYQYDALTNLLGN